MSVFIPRALSRNRLFIIGLLSISLLPSLAHAGLFSWFKSTNHTSSNHDEFLTPEQAFNLTAHQTTEALNLNFTIAPGYYLYREQLKISPEGATLGEWQLPSGEPHQDNYYGESQVYKQSFTLSLPLAAVSESAQVKVQYQGCTQDLCYAPQTVWLPLSLKN